MNEPVPIPRSRTVASLSGNLAVPVAIAGAGDHAASLEFFAAAIGDELGLR